jgi:hypothetical protein
MTSEQAGALGIHAKGAVDAESPGTGVIEVFVTDSGRLSVDGQDVGVLFPRESRQILHQSPGTHKLRFVGALTQEKSVVVESGGIVYSAFGVKSPIDETGTTPTGNLHLSADRFWGTVYIDDYEMGVLNPGDSLTIKNLTLGNHSYRVVSANSVSIGEVSVTSGGTTSLAIPPPSNLTAIVQ